MKKIATRTLLILTLTCIGVHGMAAAAHAKPASTSQTAVSGGSSPIAQRGVVEAADR